LIKKGLRIHVRGITDVPTLGIRNAKTIFGQCGPGVLQGLPRSHTITFVKSNIRLIRYTNILSGRDDSFVEAINRILFIEQVRWDFRNIGIQAYTKKRLLSLDLSNKFLSVHAICLAILSNSSPFQGLRNHTYPRVLLQYFLLCLG